MAGHHLKQLSWPPFLCSVSQPPLHTPTNATIINPTEPSNLAPSLQPRAWTTLAEDTNPGSRRQLSNNPVVPNPPVSTSSSLTEPPADGSTRPLLNQELKSKRLLDMMNPPHQHLKKISKTIS